jgi:5-methyltetrahydropteroyltriglutamate--homocysteine methyltransferase
MAEGGYDPVADVLFNAIDVDGYFLEYDTARAGTFAPLRLLPKGSKVVVLGIMSSKRPEIESVDDLKRRIDETPRSCRSNSSPSARSGAFPARSAATH